MQNRIIKKIIAIFLFSIMLIFTRSYTTTSQDNKVTFQYNFGPKEELKFNESGAFKIVQFTDLHEHSIENVKTTKLIENILNSEKPDLVVLTGDNIDGRYLKKEDVSKVIANIARPMENRKIPWAVVLGNHDCESCNVSRKKEMKIYMSFRYNLSKDYSSVPGRSGDYNLIIKDSNGNKPVFNIYMLDSGSYYHNGYDYIKTQQIAWYEKQSASLKKISGKSVPSLMFFHIALKQQNNAWKTKKAIGSRNEKESTQTIDNKMFSALIKMGDVKGVFVGHDHTNDYLGTLKGISLGYGRCTGYDGYGKKGYVRGARVFIIYESNPGNFKTYERLETNCP